jgi:hypothetical protein
MVGTQRSKILMYLKSKAKEKKGSKVSLRAAAIAYASKGPLCIHSILSSYSSLNNLSYYVSSFRFAWCALVKSTLLFKSKRVSINPNL